MATVETVRGPIDVHDRIVISHDAACYMDYFAGGPAQQALAQATPKG